jgi:hypothetical protein
MSVGHGRYAELAAASLDFELTALESAALAAHLADCATCRRLADDLRSDDRTLRRLTAGRPSDAVRERVAAAVARPRPRVRWSRAVALLAASLGVVLLGLTTTGVASWVRLGADRAELEWRRVAPDQGFPASVGPSAVRALGHAVGQGGLDLVAVGSDDTAGRVWRSADGRHWWIASDEAFERGRPVAVASAGHRVTVVGSSIDELGAPVATVWTSDGFGEWHRATLVGSTGLRAVVMTPSRTFVAGAARSGHGAPVWVSSDGQEWVVANDDGGFAGAVVTGLALGGPGIVAVGYDDRGAVTWSSPDGRDWARATERTFVSRRITAVTPAPAGLVAVGFGADGAATWRSLDGRAWTIGGSPGSDIERLTSVIATSNGILAVGSAAAGPVVWRTDDGRRWEALGSSVWSPDDELSALGTRGTRVVVGGRSGLDAAVWLGETP